ncbi:MAG: NAD(+) diphosphatase [Gammaproteobacteria bacterium]|nr:NAD(+) diphosphatase [Gammaproteobacteria bacterium]
MLLINNHSTFKPLHQPCPVPEEKDFLFCYENNKIGLTLNNELPIVSDIAALTDKSKLHCFGQVDCHKCFLLERDQLKFPLNFKQIRLANSLLSSERYSAVALGNHIAHWRANNIYCGKCGADMEDHILERARFCPACNNIVYPRISPCIIVLVTHGEKMLLARSPHFPPQIMSALAGFIEPGESLEQAIIREVKEEVGVEINQLQYVASQPWPFPDSLMLGFTAKYVSGDICIDNDEIESADWFDRNNLPPLPHEMSIARHLIELHLQSCIAS